MGLSINVIVDSRETIEFPDRCIVCGQHARGRAVHLRANPSGWNGMIPWVLRLTRLLLVPAHDNCGRKLWWGLLCRNLSLLILVTAAIPVGIWLGWNKWLTLGAITALALVPIAWQVVNPPAFEFTYRQGRYTLSFRERALAEEVAELNSGIVDEEDAEEAI